jgi:hypothetical protein
LALRKALAPHETFDQQKKTEETMSQTIETFLLNTGYDIVRLKELSDEQQREVVISFVHNNSGLPVLDLRAMSDQEVVQLALEWSLTSAVSLRTALVTARWRGEDLPTAKQLEDMSLKDRLANLEGFRNTLILELAGHSDKDGGYYQGKTNYEIAGKAAVVTFLLLKGRNSAQLKAMSDEQQREIISGEIHNNTDLPFDDLRAMSDEKLLQLAREWTITSTAITYSGDGTYQKPLLFDAPRKMLSPEDSYYVHTAVHINATREEQFNTLKNTRTKNVNVSGATLIFAKGNDYKKQMAFQGEDVLDLKRLDIYADQVIIKTPLRFPKTSVTIYARELIFEDNGSIDTSPVSYKDAAVSPFLDADRRPLDKKGGEVKSVAAGGKKGEQGGNIQFYVRRILQRPLGQTRFFAKGSTGQKAENGGRKPYAPVEGRPKTDKNVASVASADIRRYIGNLKGLTNVDDWRWPGEVSSPEAVSMDDNALQASKVVHCRLVLFDDNSASGQTIRAFFPGEDTKINSAVHLAPLGVKTGFNRGSLKDYEEHEDGSKLRPGDGEDAYQSGRPGDGGVGGNVTAYVPASVSIQGLCNVTGGEPGERSGDIEGAEPGKPYPAYWLKMRLVRKEKLWPYANSVISPTISLEKVSAKPGKASTGQAGVRGQDGTVTKEVGGLISWVRPEALGAVVNYARDLYRNGHPEKARKILDPYYYALHCDKENLPAALLGKFTEITSIRANAINNLDFYGNPPGWLPRLDAETNYQIWNLYSKHSSQILYFARKMEHEWDKIDDEQEALNEVSNVITADLDATADALEESYLELEKAHKKLDDVRGKFAVKEQEVENLRHSAEHDAENAIEGQRIFKGVMNIVGGLAQSIPVGQPFLGLAGKTVSLGGEFDWNRPDSSKQIGAFFAGVSKETGTFLTKNKSFFIADTGAEDPKSLLPRAKKKVRLTQQLNDAKGAIQSLDNKVAKTKKDMDKAIKGEWDEVLKSESEKIQTEKRPLVTQLATATGEKKKELEEAIADYEIYEQELKDAAENKFVSAKAMFYDVLAEFGKDVKSKANATVKRKEDLLANAERIEKQKSDLVKLDTLYDLDKKDAEAKTKKLLADLSDLSDGISKIGKGVVALTEPYDEAEVDRLTEESLKGSKYKEQYHKLISEIKDINRDKAQAMAAFRQEQQLISTYTAQISSAAVELNALSNQRQIADGVLDPGMKVYLQGMQNRAKENLLWSQYLFVKAWQYENLSDVSDDFYNLEQWVERFRDFERGRAGFPVDPNTSKPTYTDTPANQKRIANTFLKEADFIAIGDKVRKAHVTFLVQPVIEEREHHPRASVNTKTCSLTAAQRSRLQKEGRVTLNLINDFQLASLNHVKLRISGIDLEKFKLSSVENIPGISIDFVHSGTSVLCSVNKNRYKFEMGSEDSPISWGFVYNHNDYLRLKDSGNSEKEIWSYQGKKPINKDKVEDGVENKITKKELGETLKYREYRPAAFSDITLWINRGQHHDKQRYEQTLRDFKTIEAVEFAVTYASEGIV